MPMVARIGLTPDAIKALKDENTISVPIENLFPLSSPHPGSIITLEMSSIEPPPDKRDHDGRAPLWISPAVNEAVADGALTSTAVETAMQIFSAALCVLGVETVVIPDAVLGNLPPLVFLRSNGVTKINVLRNKPDGIQ